MKAVVSLRKTLKVRTIFNLLGPLVNPLRPTGQVLGVSNEALVPVMAEALQQLGIRHGLVLYGQEGLDEGGLGSPTVVATVTPTGSAIDLTTISPETLGLTPAAITVLRGGDVAENAEILQQVLQGKGTQPQREVVMLNAGFALQVGQRVSSLQAGVELAGTLLSSGAPWQKLRELVEFTA
jgi:anthranilate phosphoribosyltransferase